MNEIYNEILDAMDEGLLVLMKKVPSPQKVPFQSSFVYCYVENNIRQAIILKLVRLISGLRATRLLVENGFVQEQASLQRMLDEITESIEFLSYAVAAGDITDLHKEYLQAFYEKVDIKSSKNRPMIRREKLRKYITSMDRKFSQMSGINIDGANETAGKDLFKILIKIYSDYLHAAAPAIMDLYYGKTGTFHTNGVLGTPRHREHMLDFMHVFHRAIQDFIFASRALGEKDVGNKIREASEPFNELYFRHFPQVENPQQG